jgi:hypothetical protein
MYHDRLHGVQKPRRPNLISSDSIKWKLSRGHPSYSSLSVTPPAMLCCETPYRFLVDYILPLPFPYHLAAKYTYVHQFRTVTRHVLLVDLATNWPIANRATREHMGRYAPEKHTRANKEKKHRLELIHLEMMAYSNLVFGSSRPCVCVPIVPRLSETLR